MAKEEATTTILLNRLLGHAAGHTAITSDAGAITYGAVMAGSEAVARQLQAGAASLYGARVAMLMPPGAAFVEALLGIWRAGGVAVPTSPLQTVPEFDHILAVAAPETVVVDPDLRPMLDEWLAGATSRPPGRCVEWGAAAAHRRHPVAGGGAGTGAAGAPAPPRAAGDLTGKSAALMLFTSGTTGKPKGVTLSHEGIVATLESLHQAWRWKEDDRLLHALPLNHTHGLVVALLGALWAGASIRFMEFDAARVWETFAEVTVFMAVPTMYVRLVDALRAQPRQRMETWTEGARTLRLATSGSAALPPSVLTAFAQATGQTILERYGMTEIGMALSNPYDGPRIAGAVGLPLPGVAVDIVDEAGSVATDGEPGELRVWSPQLFLGYEGDPQATAAAYDEAGRFRTGDTGVRGTDGYVRLLGRTSVDILKSGGYKLSALEIEDVLRRHPQIAEVAVIGVPDDVWGDCVTACVVPCPGTPPPTLDQLRAFARHALAPYKLPRALRLLSTLPRTPMGKVQKSLLK